MEYTTNTTLLLYESRSSRFFHDIDSNSGTPILGANFDPNVGHFSSQWLILPPHQGTLGLYNVSIIGICPLVQCDLKLQGIHVGIVH